MSWDRVSIISPPTVLAVPLDKIKRSARIELTETYDDDEITRMIKDAAEYISGPFGCGYALMSQTWRYTLRGFPNDFALMGAPVASITSIKYRDINGDEQTLSTSVYRLVTGLSKARIILNAGHSWPAVEDAEDAVNVDYVLGVDNVDDIPSRLVSAVSAYVNNLYDGEGVDKSIFNDLVREYRQSWVAS